MPALFPIAEELGPGFLGLADEDDVSERAEVILLYSYPGPADHGEDAALLQLGQNLAHAEALNAHAGHTHDIGAGQAVVIEGLDIFVKKRDVVPWWSQGCQQRQASNGQIGSLSEQRQGMFQAPVGDIEAWVDQYDVCHDLRAPRTKDVPARSTGPGADRGGPSREHTDTGRKNL